MDFLPIPRSSTNKVNSAINLANDGGSKSNTGYFSKRGAQEGTAEEKIDEVSLSTSSLENTEEDLDSELTKFFNSIADFLKKIKDFILRLLGLNRPKIENIYKKNSSEIL